MIEQCAYLECSFRGIRVESSERHERLLSEEQIQEAATHFAHSE